MRRALGIVVVVFTAASALAQDFDAEARVVLQNILAKDYEAAAKNFNGPMMVGLPPAKLKEVFENQISPQLGAFQSAGKSTISSEQGFTVVTIPAQFEKGPIKVVVSFDSGGKVAGLWFGAGPPPTEPAPTRFEEYKTKTSLRLPFDGEWSVFWGGRTREQNYHVISVDQRFAYDFVIRRKGFTYAGSKLENESYFCWDAPIYAPAGGVVTVAVDGIADNTPGVMNPSVPPGNHVVIDHGNGEYSLLAHFRNGTVVPKVGDRVKRGALLGHCGNSGNSSEPHLHYHLQTAAHFGDGEGLPAQFTNYLANGHPVALGEPVRGERVKNK